MNKWVLIFVIIIVVALSIFYLADNGDVPLETDTESDSSVMEITGSAIAADTQDAGVLGIVKTVHLEAPGYVVVHKEQEGAPGEVIGHSSLLPSGESTDVSITLDSATEPGDQIFFMLHGDDGNGTYHFPGDDGPVLDEDENIVMTLVNVAAHQDVTDEAMEMEEGDNSMETEESETEGTEASDPDEEMSQEDDAIEISYTSEGFVPETITIEAGQTVRWLNNGDRNMWVASNLHPTHTIYPEESEEDCLGSTFDACTGVAPGASWEFTFSKVGSWQYHDHLTPNRKGVVNVE